MQPGLKELYDYTPCKLSVRILLRPLRSKVSPFKEKNAIIDFIFDISHHLKSLHFNFSLKASLSSSPGPADIACQLFGSFQLPRVII